MPLRRFDFGWTTEPEYPPLCIYCQGDRPNAHWRLQAEWEQREIGMDGRSRMVRGFTKACLFPCCGRCRWTLALSELFVGWLTMLVLLFFGGVGFALGYCFSGPKDTQGILVTLGAGAAGVAVGVGVLFWRERAFPPPVRYESTDACYTLVMPESPYAAAFAEKNRINQRPV